jgi:Fe-S-cluster containining protein
MTRQPWYREGLRFQCTRCGNCCTGPAGFVWVDDDEVRAIAEHLGEPLDVCRGTRTRQLDRGRSLRERANGDCIFFDREAGCTIYPVRPRQCRTWPFWDSNLASPAEWERTRRLCPGVGRGDLIPVEEITRRAAEIRL